MRYSLIYKKKKLFFEGIKVLDIGCNMELDKSYKKKYKKFIL